MKVSGLRIRPLFRLWLLLALLMIPGSVHADTIVTAEAGVPAASPDAIDWLEPQGLHIVDLVGQVPDSYLAGATITHTPGFGIVRYESGSRSGQTVTIITKIYPRFIIDGSWNGTLLSCLGQPARIDQMGVTIGPSTVRLYEGGRDVTREVDQFTYIPSGKNKPARNPRESESQNQYRYNESAMAPTTFTSDGQLIVPGNMGCELLMSRKNYRELSAVWTIQGSAPVQVSVISTSTIEFHSYLGPGYRGLLGSLVDQLYRAGFQNRAESVLLTPPAEADYFFFKYPPSLVDPHTQFPNNPQGNVDRPVAGTYRIAIQPGLSVDHVNSMALPLFGHWQDVDQCGSTFLTYAKQPLRLATPEYFVPPGIPYNACMVNGGCPRDLLDRIYNTTTSARLIYLRVNRTSANLERIPLRMAGAGYRAATTAADSVLPPAEADPNAQPLALRKKIFLPGVARPVPPPTLPVDDPSGCSSMGGCGWFTPDGRMVDYIPAP